MAWCLQATSHYLNHCWLRSISPYGITRPQWVKLTVYTPNLALTTNLEVSFVNILENTGHVMVVLDYISCLYHLSVLLTFGLVANYCLIKDKDFRMTQVMVQIYLMNPSGVQNGILGTNKINTVVADVLLPWVTRSSAAMACRVGCEYVGEHWPSYDGTWLYKMLTPPLCLTYPWTGCQLLPYIKIKIFLRRRSCDSYI